MTINEAREQVRRWLIGEWRDVVGTSLLTDRIPLAYSTFEDGTHFIQEQWYIDIAEQRLVCAFNGKDLYDIHARTLEDLIDKLWSYDFDGLIGEADDWIYNHPEFFEGDRFKVHTDSGVSF